MAIDPRNQPQIARIDNNLMVIKDKIEEAERISGGTRSAFLESLSLDTDKRVLQSTKPQKKTIAIKIMLEVEGDGVSLVRPEKEVQVDPRDPMGVKDMLRQKRFRLLRSHMSGHGLLTT